MKKQIQTVIFLSICLLLKINFITAQTGQLIVCDDLSMTASTSYEVEIKDETGAGSGHDQIEVGGDLTLSGTLDILLSGYTTELNGEFEILSYDGVLSGAFSTINWPDEMISQGWLIDYGVLTPGKVTIYGPSVVLPVSYISFGVEPDNGVNTLRWITATEINNDYFSVEVSTDGTLYSSIGKVMSKEQSNVYNEYNYAHKSDQNGRLYYRLQQVDLNGQYEYSDVVSIYMNQNKEISLFPNPTSGVVNFNETQFGISVYNNMGKELLNINEQNTTYDLSSLPSGVYFIRTKGVQSITERLIINK